MSFFFFFFKSIIKGYVGEENWYESRSQVYAQAEQFHKKVHIKIADIG